VLTVDTPRQLLEQRFHDLLKLLRFHDVQNLFDLVEEHDLLGRVDLGPIPQETHHDLFRQRSVFFQELDDTVGELRVVERQRFGLVQGDEDPGEESFVFLLERECEPVDDGTEYLEELSDSVVSLGFIDKLEKDIVDGSTDESSEVEEFPINPVEGRLEEIPFPRILAIEQLQQLQAPTLYISLDRRRTLTPHTLATHVQDKRLIDILLADIGAKIRVLHEPEEELVDDLQVRPSEFEYGFILFRIESIAGWVDLGRDRTEQVGRELASQKPHACQ
jgi:hypothetical protein